MITIKNESFTTFCELLKPYWHLQKDRLVRMNGVWICEIRQGG